MNTFPLKLLALAGLIGLAAVFAGPVAAGPARAADSKNMLEEVRRTLKGMRARRESNRLAAEAYASELAALKRHLVSAARRAQKHEARMTGLERRIATLHTEKTRKTEKLGRRRQDLARALAALQRLSRHPPMALIALPASPADTVRSAILLRGAVPRMEARAATLRRDLSRLAVLRSRISSERDELARAGIGLDRERARLSQLIRRKVSLERRALAESWAANARITELAAEARNLKELIDRLAATRRRQRAARAPTPEKKRPPPAISGRLPAEGRIVERFRKIGIDGARSKGITIETRPAARVVAPGNGEIVFAGPFRGYGQLLIIEHGEGYHVLLSGMKRMDAVVGDEVLEGEPVGVMDTLPGRKPKLYFELRRNGSPVNPLPWLAASKDKVNG